MYRSNSEYYDDDEFKGETEEINTEQPMFHLTPSRHKPSMTESEEALERLIAERIGKLDCGFDPDADDCHFELENDVFGVCRNNEEEEEEEEVDEEPDYTCGGPEVEVEIEEEVEKPKPTMVLSVPPESVPKPEDLYYHGLAMQPHVHPDYPRDLKLRKVCTPKVPLKRKTVDNFKTEALARFSPANSKDNLIKSSAVTKKGGIIETSEESKIPEGPDRLCAPHLAMRELPPVATINDEIIVDYIDDYNIQMMLEYFLSLALYNTPGDPYEFISHVADQMILARYDSESFKKLPRMLQHEHVKSVFRIYDRIGTGTITHAQYLSAMEVIGIIHYNAKPDGYDEDKIAESTYVTEASNAIDHLMKSFMFRKQQSPDDPCEYVSQPKKCE